MNFKTTLALLLLVAAVALYFAFVERGTTSMRERERQAEQTSGETGTPLLADDAFSPDSVTRLELKRDGQTAVIEKTNGNWRQTQPVQFPLTSRALGGVTGDLDSLRYVDRFTPGSEGTPALGEVGLESPRAELTVTHGETTTTLRLGDKSLGSHAYLMRGDEEQVYVVTDGLHDRILDNTVQDWRKKTFDAPAASGTDRVALSRAQQGELNLLKRDGDWFLDEAQTQRASSDAVDELVSAVGSARVQGFVKDKPDDMALYGLKQPRLELTMHTPAADTGDNGDGDTSAEDDASGQDEVNTYTLRVGSAADMEESQFFATWSKGENASPVVFTLNKSDIEPLEKQIDDLRDPRLITTESDEIKVLRATRPDQPTLHLVRDTSEGFVFGDPKPGYGVDYDTATSMLERFAGTEADGYVADFDAPDQALMTVELTQRGSGLTETIKLYEAPGADDSDEQQYLSVREGEPVAYRVSRAKIAELFKPRLAYRNKDIINVERSSITQATLQRADGVTFTFQREAPASTQAAATQPNGESGEQNVDTEANWTLEGHDTFEADALDDLLGTFAPLRAEKWVTDGSVQPADDWASLTIEAMDGSPRVLRVDIESRRAVLQGIEPGFVLPQSFVDKLTAEYRDRTALDLNTDNIASVTVEAGDQTLVVSKNADDQYVTESGTEIDQSKAGKMFDTLAGLQVERYVKQRRIAPTRKLIVQTTDDQTFTVGLHGEDSAYAALSPVDTPFRAAFTLGDDALEKLRFDLTNKEDEGSDDSEGGAPGMGGRGMPTPPGGAGGGGGGRIPPGMIK